MAFASLEECLDAIQTACAAVSGVKFGPTKPPESPNDFPFVVTYPTSITHHQGPAGYLTFLYDIVVELHIERSFLPEDTETAYPYAESVPNAVYDCLNDNAAAQGEGTGRFGFLGWGTDEDRDNQPYPTIGFSWTFGKVKIQKAVT